jgi:hypothetical protein
MTHMDEAEQEEAIRLYQSGLSLAAVGERLNRSSFSFLGVPRRNGVPSAERNRSHTRVVTPVGFR